MVVSEFRQRQLTGFKLAGLYLLVSIKTRLESRCLTMSASGGSEFATTSAARPIYESSLRLRATPLTATPYGSKQANHNYSAYGRRVHQRHPLRPLHRRQLPTVFLHQANNINSTVHTSCPPQEVAVPTKSPSHQRTCRRWLGRAGCIELTGRD